MPTRPWEDVERGTRLASPDLILSGHVSVDLQPSSAPQAVRPDGQALLAGSLRPIAEIAVACGFAHQAHLTTAFRRATGATPAAWRRDSRA